MHLSLALYFCGHVKNQPCHYRIGYTYSWMCYLKLHLQEAMLEEALVHVLQGSDAKTFDG